jgi:hypothetical protein
LCCSCEDEDKQETVATANSSNEATDAVNCRPTHFGSSASGIST